MNVIDMFSLKGKVAIVTGGAGHLGKAMTEALLEAGAKVYILSRNEEAYNACNFCNDNVKFLKGDILDSKIIKSCFAKVYSENGRIDILINNAVFINGGGKIPENITDEMWADTSEGVLASSFKCIREVIPYMEKNNYGKIINIGSMYGIVSPDISMYEGECRDYLNPVHYGALKAGVIQMTKYFGAYLINKGINVNAISPGTFPSPEIQENSKIFIDRLKHKNPALRIGRPEDLKGTILLLASHASDYIVGQNIVVDGGWTIW